MIQLFNHTIYPAFWVVFVLIPILLIVAGFFVFSKKERKPKAIKTTNLDFITDWQREKVPALIDMEIEEFPEKEILHKLKDYMSKNNRWVKDELLKAHPDLIYEFTDSLFHRAIREYYEDKNIDRAVLYLHCIDQINGGLTEVEKKWRWIDEEIPKESSNLEMPDAEARMEHAWLESIRNQILKFDEKTNEIPKSETISYFEEIYKISKEDFIEAGETVAESKDMFTIPRKSAYEIVITSLFADLQDTLLIMKDKTLSKYRLMVLRSLICALDKNDYLKIVDTIG